jgi:hypothetical protein
LTIKIKTGRYNILVNFKRCQLWHNNPSWWVWIQPPPARIKIDQNVVTPGRDFNSHFIKLFFEEITQVQRNLSQFYKMCHWNHDRTLHQFWSILVVASGGWIRTHPLLIIKPDCANAAGLGGNVYLMAADLTSWLRSTALKTTKMTVYGSTKMAERMVARTEMWV